MDKISTSKIPWFVRKARRASREEAIAIMSRVARLVARYRTVAWFGQPEYKADFFRVFVDAFKGGYCGNTKTKPFIMGERLYAFAEAVLKDERRSYRPDTLETVCMWWDEWTYALCQFPPSR